MNARAQRRRSRGRAQRAVVATLVALACLVLSIPLTASAAGDSSISGRVWMPDGVTPAAGGTVRLWRNVSGTWSLYSTKATGPDGTYSFTSLPNTTYKVEFRATGCLTEYWDDASSLTAADIITLGAAENRTGIDATMAWACGITGVVRDSAGMPLSGITVNAYRHLGGTSYDLVSPPSVVTGADGVYSFSTLAAGSYALQFFSGTYAPHYRSADPASGVTAIERATPVTVTSGQLTGIDETMLRWGAIAGSVSSQSGPVANVSIDTYRWEGTGWIRQLTGMTTSDGSGAFTSTPLYPGSYRVLFTAPTTYPAQYHRSTLDILKACDVVVDDGGTTRLDTILVASDTQAPVSSIEGVPAGWSNSITASIQATDGPTGSGVVETWWGIDSDPATLGADPIAMTREGTHTISYWSVDGFGNTEAPKTATATLDVTPPTVSSDATTAAYGNTATITVSATDALSGVERVVHRIGAAGAETTGPIVVLGVGVHELYVGAYDVAGNWSGFGGPSIVTVVPPPAAPAGLSAASTEPGPAAAVSWSDASDVEDGYVVERARDSTESAAFSHVATLGPGATSYADADPVLDRTSTWYYRVRAYNVAGNSGWALSGGVRLRIPTITVYRFYNWRAGVHFYTASGVERDNVIATLGHVYTYEGPSYKAYPSAVGGAVAVYRFYNRRTGTHFYTASGVERDRVLAELSHVYTLEGPAYYVLTSEGAETLTVHRFYNRLRGTHFYTSSGSEKDNVIATLGHVYTYEGIAYHVPE